MGEGSPGGALDPVDDYGITLHSEEIRESPKPFTTVDGVLPERSAVDRLSALGRDEPDPGPDLPRKPVLWSMEAADEMRAILDE